VRKVYWKTSVQEEIVYGENMGTGRNSILGEKVTETYSALDTRIKKCIGRKCVLGVKEYCDKKVYLRKSVLEEIVQL
jgi:hypothetical protein